MKKKFKDILLSILILLCLSISELKDLGNDNEIESDYIVINVIYIFAEHAR